MYSMVFICLFTEGAGGEGERERDRGEHFLGIGKQRRSFWLTRHESGGPHIQSKAKQQLRQKRPKPLKLEEKGKLCTDKSTRKASKGAVLIQSKQASKEPNKKIDPRIYPDLHFLVS